MNPFTILGRAQKDGSCTVYIKLYIGGERILINTKVVVSPDTWDSKKICIKSKTGTSGDDNMIISRCHSRANDILVKYRLQNKKLTVDLFKKEYSNPSLDIDFLVWMASEIKIKKNEVGELRIIKYNTILNKLKEYRPKIYFSEIDHFFITSFKGWLRTTKRNDVNTISSNLAVLKSFTNRALKKKLIEQDPFEDIRIGRGASDRVYCEEEELEKLWNLYNNWIYPMQAHQKKILRHFLFMCFTGLRISDFKAAEFDDIINGLLCFRPIKTRSMKKQKVKVPLNEYALKLISDEGRKTGLIFEPYSEQLMNVNLKDIAKMAGINKPLTNHSGRHTFATLFLQKTHDVATLQKLLGHSRIEETMIYVHITECELIKQVVKWTNELNFRNPDPVIL